MPDNHQPVTPRQEASRLNGAKSRGPVTTEGKRKSSQNAARHGLFAIPKITLSNEGQPEFEADVRELIEKYQPADCEERKAIAEYAISRWRLERVWLMETAAIDMRLIDVDAQMPETGPQWTDAQMTFLAYDRLWRDSRFFANLGLYETRLRRASERAKRKLDNFLASRSAQEPQALPVVAPRDPPTPALVAEKEPQVPLSIRKNEPRPFIPKLPGSARNRPCPCGSGQKYKRCCLLNPSKAA